MKRAGLIILLLGLAGNTAAGQFGDFEFGLSYAHARTDNSESNFTYFWRESDTGGTTTIGPVDRVLREETTDSYALQFNAAIAMANHLHGLFVDVGRYDMGDSRSVRVQLIPHCVGYRYRYNRFVVQPFFELGTCVAEYDVRLNLVPETGAYYNFDDVTEIAPTLRLGVAFMLDRQFSLFAGYRRETYVIDYEDSDDYVFSFRTIEEEMEGKVRVHSYYAGLAYNF